MYCTYSVTLRRIRPTIVAMEKQEVLHILGVCFCLNYLAWYCHLCPAPLHNILPHYPINGTICGIKVTDIKRVF